MATTLTRAGSQVHGAAAAGAALPDDALLPPSNILIVDDRSDKRIVFRTVLEELGQNIVTASSGEEALRWLLDNDCAVILLDVNMPGMDGLETAELIRARRKSAHLPIIFITAFADEMHTARGYSLGAVDYILSPVVPNVLRSKVKALVQLHQLSEELKRRADERVALAQEQMARTAAEDSQRRASFLAEATQVMGSSLDIDTISRGVSGLVVPFIADYSAIVLIGEDGVLHGHQASGVPEWERYIGVHHPSFDAALAELQELVIANGQRVSFDRLVRSGGESVESNGFPAGELHGFPLVTRGKSRGVLMLALGPSLRHLTSDDIALADSLAGRAASSFDNCLLYEEIQGADRRKNEFLATLSHELRNPLAPMRAALYMLRAGHSDNAPALLESMDRQTRRMTRLVEDLLDVSRISRGAIELRRESLDVCSELRSVLQSCEILATGSHKLSVELPEEPLYVMADSVRFQQIVENLVGNAVKYTSPGGHIVVSLAAEADKIVIRIRDDGIGIAPEKLASIWGLFVQVDDSPERRTDGLGIGLALVKDLVQRHGGTASAESEGLGKGSVFTVTFPRAARGEMKEHKVPDISPFEATAVRRVLVVDDNTDAAETLTMMLQLLGQETRQEHDGPGALRAAAEYSPEVVFMDIGLPGLSGLEVASRMRRDLGLANAYLVALSGYGSEEDHRKSFHAGFDKHVVKPLDPAMLPGILAAAARH